MTNQLDDAENQSRRDNMQILNLKEGTEGDNPLEFFESSEACPRPKGV